MIYPILLVLLLSELLANGVYAFFRIISSDPLAEYNHFTLALTGFMDLLCALIGILLYKKDRIGRLAGGLTAGRQTEEKKKGNHPAFLLIAMFFWGGALAILFNYIVSLLFTFIDYSAYNEAINTLVENHSLVFQIFVVGLLAPIGEEAVFRWLVFLRLRDYTSFPWAAVISAALFGIYHGNLLQFIYAGALGLFFAWALEKTGCLWSSAAVHMGANTIITLFPMLLSWLLQKEWYHLIFILFFLVCAVLVAGFYLMLAVFSKSQKRKI